MFKVICNPHTLLLVVFLSLPFVALAGAPAGHLESLDSNIREGVSDNLQREGYMAHFANGQDLQRGISAYLWDNRQWLQQVDFHNARQVDVLVCLMIKKGYGDFEEYAENKDFIGWCRKMLKP